MRYVYEGTEPAIQLKGAVLRRGEPVELTGAAARRADRHSAIRRVTAEEAPPTPPSPAAPSAEPPAEEPAEQRGTPSPTTEKIEAEARPPASVVRAWARENGFDVPARGALKPEIYEAYARAHS